LGIASEKLHLDRMPEKQRQRIQLLQGSLTYQDMRLVGYEAAALVEVIEHLEMNKLQALSQAVFGYARPKTVVLTTPNAEYNVKYETLSAGKFRHDDHRFEWTRAEFQSWANKVAENYQYQVSFEDIGEVDEAVGASSQMAVFVRSGVY
jgi:3' terminal RNA ribose 2'-O-methyltransferase Hen1